MITSNITFLYYKNLDEAIRFFEDTLELTMVMDQGFARVYKVTETSFLGMVKTKEEASENDTLFSFTVDDVEAYYQIFKGKNVKNLTEMNYFKDIPLKSFFFEDFSNHRFEIQEFLKKEDKITF